LSRLGLEAAKGVREGFGTLNSTEDRYFQRELKVWFILFSLSKKKKTELYLSMHCSLITKSNGYFLL
jgi:hypothetical protein